MDREDILDSANLTLDDNTSSALHETTNPHLRQTYETVLAGLFLLIIILIALLGNTAVIAVVCLQRNMRKDISNLLIINLSVTDLSNTLFVMLSALIALISDKWILGKIWCNFVCSINYCLIIVSMLTLCCISMDRHQAIMHPLSYPLRITRRRMVYVISYTWIQGITFGIAPPLAGWVAFDYWEAICAIQWQSYRPNSIIYVVLAFLLCFLIPGMVLIYCYSKILKEVKKQKAQATISTAGDRTMHEKHRKKASDRSKIIWSLLVVVLAYFICTAPFSVTKLIKVLADGTDPIPGPVNLVSALLGYVASAINPLIYGIFRRDFRAAYKRLLYSVFLRDQFQQTVSSEAPSGIHTISKANHQTINNEAENKQEQIELALGELQKTSHMLKNGRLSPETNHCPLKVEENGVKKKIGLSALADEADTGSHKNLEVLKSCSEYQGYKDSIISCKHVIVKSVNGSFDQM